MERLPSDAAPDPPWWDPPRRAEPRSALTRQAIVTTALGVLDDVGLERFSMRRVAEELGTGASTLYWHVTDKNQLIHLVLDRVMGEIELPAPDPSRWEEQVREFARAGRATFRRHPGVAQASLGRMPLGPNLVRIMEWFLAVLQGAGASVHAASSFADLLALVGAAQAVEEHTRSAVEDPTAMGEYLSRLPADRFPNLTAAVPALEAGGPDDRSEFALDLLLRGLATSLDH